MGNHAADLKGMGNHAADLKGMHGKSLQISRAWEIAADLIEWKSHEGNHWLRISKDGNRCGSQRKE
jgi:hypothetical protein